MVGKKMKIIEKLLSIINIGKDVALVPKFIMTVAINTLVAIILGFVVHRFYGTLPLVINIFFVYAGGMYVYTWDKLTQVKSDTTTLIAQAVNAELNKNDQKESG
jgi:hypothetical protein